MIYVDRRTGSRELKEYLPEGSYEISDLESGDVAFLGYGPDGPMTYPIGIERKTFYDLLECFKDTRLNQQLQKMSGYYKKIYIVVEGRPRIRHDGHILVPRKVNGKTEWVESKLTYSTIDNYLNTLTDELHIQIKRSFGLEETCWQIMDIYGHCSKESHGSHLRIDKTWEINPWMPASFEERVAQQLDGIGPTKAGLVAAMYPAVAEWGQLSEEEWCRIPGIGKTLSKSIMTQLQKKRKQQ
jgi:ERCC4-type nuclease